MALLLDDGIVRIVTSDIFAGDAIGNFNLQIRSFLHGLNIPCQIYATHYDLNANLGIAHFDDFFHDYTKDDVLLSHFSIFEERNNRLSDVRIPKAVYYHGITPPQYFDSYDRKTAENCAKGLNQFNCFVDFDYFMSNSGFMLDQLLDAISGGELSKKNELYTRSRICPPFINSSQWDCEPSGEIDNPEERCSMLYVGRVAPHKCVHELFNLLSVVVDKGINASLKIVGSCAAPDYCQELYSLLENEYSSLNQRVTSYGHVSQAELMGLYKSSDVFVTMSEHEGFCVPLVEAMRFSLPVLAKAGGAIPETLSGAGMVFYDNDYEALSDYILSLADESVKNKIISRQNDVYEEILKASDGSIILSVLEKLIQKRLSNS